MCVCVCVCVGGGGKGLENFYMQTFVYMRLLQQGFFFFGLSVFMQTLFYFHTNYFRISASANNLFQNFLTSSPPPPPTPAEKKSGLYLRRSEIMFKLNPGRRHLSMNTSQSGSSMKD